MQRQNLSRQNSPLSQSARSLTLISVSHRRVRLRAVLVRAESDTAQCQSSLDFKNFLLLKKSTYRYGLIFGSQKKCLTLRCDSQYGVTYFVNISAKSNLSAKPFCLILYCQKLSVYLTCKCRPHRPNHKNLPVWVFFFLPPLPV